MAYNTGNAPGSTSPKDLIDNAEDFDFLLTGVPPVPNRLGVPLKSWKGMEGEHNTAQVNRQSEFNATQIQKQAEFDASQSLREDVFDQYLEGSGWTTLGNYAAGISIVSHSQTVEYGGQPYALKPSVPASISAPYITSGNWATESVNFKLVGDNSLRQDLDSSLGAGMLGAARMFLAKTINRVSGFFSAGSIDPLEYGSLIVSRPDPNNSATWDATAAIEAAIAAALASRWSKRVSLSCDLGTTRTIVVPKGVDFDTPGGELTALDGITLLTAVLQFGNRLAIPEPDGRWSGWSKVIRINCRGLRVIGVDFNRVWGYAHFPSGYVKKCAYIPVKSSSGYGLSLGRWEATAPTIQSDGFNAQADSVAFWLGASDGDHGILNSYGFFCHLYTKGNNQSVSGGHPFGLYRNGAGVPQSCPLGIGVLNEGQGNVISNMVVDSVSLIDYSQPASLTNGGLAYVNRADGFQAVFQNNKLFQPNRSADGEVAPVDRVIAFTCNQAASYSGNEVVDYNTVSSVMTEHYQGANVNLCNIVSRRENRFYSTRQILFNRKSWFQKGFEFQADTDFQDADERSAVFGACSYAMPSANYLQINTNYKGSNRVVYLQRRSVAYAAGDLTSIALTLTTSERGRYVVWYEPTKKLLVWDGTAWRDTMGTLV